MKFYNRENELALLYKIEKLSNRSAQMTFVVGRRRIGKTSLLMKATEHTDFIYLFVAKKNEALLCTEFVEEIRQKLNIPIFGELKTFKHLFGLLMELSKTRPFTLIIDEFQEFTSVNPSIYSDMQNIWDSNKEQSKINLILCGSVYSMMTKIFENSKEPLFGRATQRIHLHSFPTRRSSDLLNDYYPTYTPEDLLAFYLFTGGVAKYVELLVQAEAFTFEAMLNEIMSENSLFLEEGKNVLVDEFGKDYGNYFSILSLIASGKTSRVEIESIMEIQTGGFLERLENEYGLIKKVRPILAKPNSRTVKYRSAVEAGNLDYLKEIIQRDYTTYSGTILEKYFTEQLIAEKKYNNIGTYWERNNQNEIDIVAVNDLNKIVLFAEVKRNKNNISIEKLKEKSFTLTQQFKEYQLDYRGFSLENM